MEVCPFYIFSLEREKAVLDNNDCFMCGHCRAVCPTNAIFIKDLQETLTLESADNKIQTRSNGAGFSPPLIDLMQSRRSCRNFKPETVSIELLADLVKIGTLAPSGTNCQDWEFTILPERSDVAQLGNLVGNYYKKLNRLAERPLLRNFLKMIGKDSLYNYYINHYETVEKALSEWDEEQKDRLFHGATAAIIVSNRTIASCPGEDALLATQNILLAAESVGLGSCLIGFAVEAIRRSSFLQGKLGIPKGEQVYSVICLGYPAVKFYRTAGRKQVKSRILKLEASG